MEKVHFRTWAPSGSPVRIEYSLDLLKQLRFNSAEGDQSGFLWGAKVENSVRVVASRPSAGLDTVGVFVVRTRGEVFLTESDLERLGSFNIALVMVGSKGGFFVREPGGSIQTIRSYQEFLMAPPPKTKPLERRRVYSWAWACLGLLALLAVPLMAQSYWRPLLAHPPVILTVREEAGQLAIGWDPEMVGRHGRLEILDGAGQTTVPISSPALASVTYAHDSEKVEVRLIVDDDPPSASPNWRKFYTSTVNAFSARSTGR
jgi:hypothetical protein